MNNSAKKTLSTVLCTAAAILWGYAFVAQKMLSYDIKPFTVGAARAFIAMITITVAVIVFDKVSGKGRRLFSIKDRRFKIDITKTEFIGGICCGLIISAATTVQQYGITGTDSGKAAFITTLYVVIVPIYALFFKKKSPPLVWVSVAVAVVGFYLISAKDGFVIEASDMLVFLCALIFAWHIIVIDFFSPKGDGIRISLVQFATMFLITTPIAVIAEKPEFSAIISSLLPLIYLGVFSSGIAYTMQIVGQRYANPAVASILLSLESVFGVIGGALILKEQMTAREYIGCIIVFAAVVISQLSTTSNEPALPKDSSEAKAGAKSEQQKNAYGERCQEVTSDAHESHSPILSDDENNISGINPK